MRDELAVATAQFVEQLNLANPVPDIGEETRERLINLVDFVTRSRSPVERDARNTTSSLYQHPKQSVACCEN